MKTRHLCAALVLALGAPQVHAQWEPRFSFSGYGTLGVVHSDYDQADYLVDAFKPTGPGHTRDWSADVDSRIAGQASAAFGDRLSAVVQVIVQQRHDDTYKPVVEWANVKYQFTPDLSVRAGRVVLPVFMVTESRRVGYANPWVRPPVEVYSLVPVTSVDGVDASWRVQGGGFTHTVGANAGRANAKFPSSSGVEASEAIVRDLFALAYTAESGALTARVNYGRATLTIGSYDPLFEAFRFFGPQGQAIADRYHVTDRRVDFLGFSANYDPGPWFATAEWARFDTHSVLAERSGWYVSGGARFGRFTPYATYAQIKVDSNTSDPGVDLALLPPQVQPLAAQANFILNQQLANFPDQKTVSLGVRWDFAKSAALKLQWDRVEMGAGSKGTFGNVQPGFQPGRTVRVVSAAVDFVF